MAIWYITRRSLRYIRTRFQFLAPSDLAIMTHLKLPFSHVAASLPQGGERRLGGAEWQYACNRMRVQVQQQVQ